MKFLSFCVCVTFLVFLLCASCSSVSEEEKSIRLISDLKEFRLRQYSCEAMAKFFLSFYTNSHKGFSIAIKQNSLELTEILIDLDLDMTIVLKDGSGQNLLHASLLQERPEIAKFLLIKMKEKLDDDTFMKVINAIDFEGRNVLYHAVRRKYFEIIDMLIDFGADVTTVITFHEEPHESDGNILSREIFNRDLPMILHLINKIKERYGEDCDEIKRLINDVVVPKAEVINFDTFVDVDAEIEVYSAFYLALKQGPIELINFLIDSGADLIAKTQWKQFNIFHFCIILNKREKMKFLFDKITSKYTEDESKAMLRGLLNETDFFGNIPLNYMIRRSAADSIPFFVTHGCELIIKPSKYPEYYIKSPLFSAITLNRVECAKVLLDVAAAKYGTDSHEFNELINEKDAKTDDCPLIWAARLGLVEIVKKLILLGANCNVKDRNGDNVFHFAVYKNSPDLLKELLLLLKDQRFLDGLLNGDGCNFYYPTPLHLACKLGNTTIARMLLEAGSEIHLKNRLFTFNLVYNEIDADTWILQPYLPEFPYDYVMNPKNGACPELIQLFTEANNRHAL